MMGCTPEWGIEHCSDVHQVTLSDFYIGKYEVTQEQWKAVMGADNNPSVFIGDKLPVNGVSWYDAQEFIEKLNVNTGRNYRLPTEAEWEYAARGGGRSRGYMFSGGNTASDVGWHERNSGALGRGLFSLFPFFELKTHPVGTKKANELGLHDMSGNVSEWTNDWHGRYGDSPQTNPQGPDKGDYRVYRGGDWQSMNWFTRSASSTEISDLFELLVSNRQMSSPDNRGRIGFRLAMSQERVVMSVNALAADYKEYVTKGSSRFRCI